jgi:hypothetical protein
MGNCSPSPRRRRPTEPASPPLNRTASAPTAAAGGGTPVSPFALARSPSMSDATVNAEDGNVVRVYGSDGCPVAWRLRVSLLYKAAAPLHFTPSEAAPLGRPVLRLSAADPELTGSIEELLRQVDDRFEGKPRVAPPERPRPTSTSAAEEVAELVRLQHRSAERHLEGVAAKVAEMATKGKKMGKGRNFVEGAEVRRLGKWYGDAMEVMLEHARMEEILIFPDLQRTAHPG